MEPIVIRFQTKRRTPHSTIRNVHSGGTPKPHGLGVFFRSCAARRGARRRRAGNDAEGLLQYSPVKRATRQNVV